jgi:competence protein ComEA
MKDWLKILAGILGGLLGAGLILLLVSRPRGQPVTLQSPPEPAPLVVHVSGAVNQPGVFTLPAGSRVKDALQAAGGLAPAAQPGALNLAALVQDGSKIAVPFVPPTPDPLRLTTAPASTPAAGVRPSPAGPKFPININTASQDELEALPGIGPVIAQKIILYRTANGPFTKIEDIQKVSGIGPKTFEEIKTLITVDG